MTSLIVYHKELFSKHGIGKSTTLDVEKIGNILRVFSDITKRLNGLWDVDIDHPLDIPSSPKDSYYRRFAMQFAKSYFYKNLLKCLIFCEIKKNELGDIDHLSDIGAGSGPFSLAVRAYFRTSHIDMIERSKSQVDLLKKVLNKLQEKNGSFIHYQGLEQFYVAGKDCIASYSIGEILTQDIDVGEFIESARHFFIIDTALAVRSLYYYFGDRPNSICAGEVEFSVGPKLRSLIEGGGGKFSYLHKL